MSDGTKRIQAQEGRGFPRVDSVHRWRNRTPKRFETLLHFKGFAGGVPQNTERTTVKPWVGIKIARGVCSLLKWHGPGAVQMQNANCIMQNPPGLSFSRKFLTILATLSFALPY
jgi:hypothetical protein